MPLSPNPGSFLDSSTWNLQLPHSSPPQSTGWSALFFAAKEGHKEIAEKLITAHADVLLTDRVSITLPAVLQYI